MSREEENKRIRALEKQLKAIEDRNEVIDSELKSLEAKLAEGLTQDGNLNILSRYEELKKEQENLESEWEEVAMALEG